MCAKDANMCGKDATLSAKHANMCGKDATMGAENAIMCAKGAAMCAKDGTTCAKSAPIRAHGRAPRGFSNFHPLPYRYPNFCTVPEASLYSRLLLLASNCGGQGRSP